MRLPARRYGPRSRQCNHQGVDSPLSICHCGLHGVVADGLPRSGLARRPGAPDPRCAGAPSLGPPGRDPSLAVVPGPVRQGSAPCRDAGCDLDGAAGLAGRRAAAHGQGSLDRLVPAAEAAPPAPGHPELPLYDPAGISRSKPGLAGARPEPAAAVGQHAGGARIPGTAGRNVRGSGALRRHLLPGRQLALAGPHRRLWAPPGRRADVAPSRPAQGDSRV